MSMQWEKVFIFISSTFNDMHAERDYLIKQVFPQLREWCERRKLRLVDIDLRWGVTEQDALYNKNVVKVCLDRIDDCRPFFLCFLGQRRGWVPAESDISDSTYEDFPELKVYVQKKTSVTEMEILHALVNPLHRSKQRDPKKSAESYDPVKHAFFYLRDDTYLGQLPDNPSQLRQTYTNESIKDEGERAVHNNELDRWRNVEIPQSSRPFHYYKGNWDTNLTTPELLLPLQCPSSETVSLKRWQSQWEQAGVKVDGDDVETIPLQAKKAHEFNRLLSTGRLTDFKVEENALSQIIVTELQEAIAIRFPNHTQITEETDLQKEMDQQEQFLFVSSEGFIRRAGDFDALDAYVDGDSNQLFALTAPGGIGKSTLLANWIENYRTRNTGKRDQSIHFRFIGQSDRSTTVYSLLQFLLREMKEVSGKFTEAIPDDPQKIRQELLKLLEAAGKKGRTVIVLDALNQLESGLADLAWLPYQLPKNVKLIISFKRGAAEAEELYQRMQGQAVLYDVRPFVSLDDRRKLVKAYLSQFLKDLDERHLDTLIKSAGADNPLFLKVVLSELRVFGAFANLGEKIRLDFGETPISAFQGVLKRLENDPAYSPIEPKQSVPLIFGLLAHTRQGLTSEELTGLLIQALGMEDNKKTQQDASDSVFLYLRQVRPFLAYHDGSYDFFFESFRLAAQESYVGEAFPRRLAKEWHKLLAEYFMTKPLKSEKDNKKILNRKKLSESTYHQASAGLSRSLVGTFTNFNFMQASITVFGPYKLMDEFELLDFPLVEILPEVKEKLLLIRDAIQLSAYILIRDATQLPGQLIGRLQSINTPLIKSFLDDAHAWWGDKPRLEPARVHFASPGGALSTTLSGEIGGSDLYALPDGKQVLAVSGITTVGRAVRIWDIEKKSLAGKYEQVSEAAVTPDGRRAALFTSRANQINLKVLEPVMLKETQSTSGPGGTIIARAISADGRLAVTVSHWGSAIKTWDPQQGRERSCIYNRLADEVIPLPKERVALLLSENYSPHNSASSYPKPAPKTISVWDIEKQECLFEITPGKMQLYSYSFLVTPDGKTGLFCGYKEISAWNMENGARIGEFTCAEPIESILLTPDGTRLISCAKGLIQVWDLAVGKELRQFQTAILNGSMAVAPNGNALAVFSGNGIETWDIAKGEVLGSFKSPEQVRNIHFLPNGDGLLVETSQQVGGGVTAPASKNVLKALELRSGKEIYTLQAAVFSAPIVITPDRRRAAAVITVGKDGKEVLSTSDPYAQFIVWDLEEGKVLSGLSGKQTGRVEVMAISADGLWILTGSDRNTEIKVWNVGTGEEADPIPLGDLSGVDKIAWSQEDQQAISVSNNYQLTVWDLEQGRALHSIFTHLIDHLLITPDGNKAVTISRDGVLKIWDLWGGADLHTLPAYPSSILARFVMMPDSQSLFSVSWVGNEVKLWDIARGTEQLSVTTQGWSSSAIAIDPKNMKTVVVGPEKLVVSDIEAGTTGNQPLGDVVIFPVTRMSGDQKKPLLTPDGNSLLVINDRQIAIWDLRTGTRKNALTADRSVSAISISPDGRRLFSGSEEALQVWDMSRLDVQGSTPGDLRHAKIVKILVTPDEKKVISAPDYQALQVWDILTRELLYTFPNAGVLGTFRVLPDGKRFIYTAPGALKIFDLETGQECLSVVTSWGRVTVSLDGKFVLMVYGNELLMVELVPGAKRRVLKKYEPGITTSRHIDLMEITPDGRQAMVSFVDYDAKKYSLALWDLQTGLEHTMEESSARIQSVEITPDGKRAVVALISQIKVWNLENGQELHCFDFVTDINSFGKVPLLTPDGKTILSAAQSGQGNKHINKAWDLESGTELHAIEPGVLKMAFLPNGRQFLYYSYDPGLRANTVKVMDLEQFKIQLVLEGSFDERGQKIVVTPDSQYAISAGLFLGGNNPHDRLVEAWDLQTGKMIARLYMDSDLSALAVAPDGRTIIVGDVVGQVHFLRLEGVIP